MSSQITQQFITRVKDTLTELAANSMTYPAADPFLHGVSCGRYQGLQNALDILCDIIQGDQEAEAKR